MECYDLESEVFSDNEETKKKCRFVSKICKVKSYIYFETKKGSLLFLIY